MKALHQAYLDRGEESPYTSWFERGFDTDRKDEFTTLIDVGDYLHKRREALLAHRTQVDPDGHWMRLPDDVIREVFPWEEFTLARSLVDNGVPEGEYEDDLFAGHPRAARRRALTPMIVEFVVAAGKKEQARGWARSTTRAVVERGDGAPRRAGRRHVHRDAGRRAGAARRHARPLGRVHARPGEDGRRLRRAAAVPAAHGRRRAARLRARRPAARASTARVQSASLPPRKTRETRAPHLP